MNAILKRIRKKMIKMPSKELDIYGDELFSEDGSNWIYIRILFVPLSIKSELLDKLLNKRCIQRNSWKWNKSQCSSTCDFHEDSNTEIYYSEIDKLYAYCKESEHFLLFIL